MHVIIIAFNFQTLVSDAWLPDRLILMKLKLGLAEGRVLYLRNSTLGIYLPDFYCRVHHILFPLDWIVFFPFFSLLASL